MFEVRTRHAEERATVTLQVRVEGRLYETPLKSYAISGGDGSATGKALAYAEGLERGMTPVGESELIAIMHGYSQRNRHAHRAWDQLVGIIRGHR